MGKQTNPRKGNEKPENKNSDSVEEQKASKVEKVQDSPVDSKDTPNTGEEKKQPIISPDEISAKELFNQSARISDQIKIKYLELEVAKAMLVIIEEAHGGIHALLKPQKRLDKRLGAPKKIENPDKRKLRKAEKGSLDNDVLLQKDKIDILQQEFNNLCEGETQALKYAKLRIKADSKKFVRENKNFLLNKAKSLLTRALTEKRDTLFDLRTKSKDISEEGIILFNSSLRELLFMIDDEGAILCSGAAIKTKLYATIRTALQGWNTRSNTIPDLVLPVDDKQKQ